MLGTATLYGWRTIKGLRHVLRDGTAGRQLADGTAGGGKVYNLQFIINSLLFRVNSLQLISREFDDKLQISFDFLGDFKKKA